MAEGSPRTVVIADDSELYRNILVRLLRAVPELEVVGAAADCREAVELCALHQPDLAVLDYDMPRMNGIEAGKGIRNFSPNTTLTLITSMLDSQIERAAMTTGFAATIAKQLGSTQIRAAIVEALQHRAEHVVVRRSVSGHRSGTRLSA